MNKAEASKIIGEKIHGIRTAVFTTMNDKGQHISRPMATQDVEFDGTLWFMTSSESEKVAQMKSNPEVGISYATGDKMKFISVSGTAEFLHDEEKIKEFWNPYYKAWFSGPEDPTITLIKVTASRVEYWDMPGGKLGAIASIATSAITGEAEDKDDNKVFEFSDSDEVTVMDGSEN